MLALRAQFVKHSHRFLMSTPDALDAIQIPPSARDHLRGGCVLTIGNFDGVHRGHRAILDAVIAEAQSAGLPAVAMTFEPHPVAFFRNAASERFRVTTSEERERRLREAGIDLVLTMPFTPAFAAVDARTFVDALLIAHCRATRIHVGYDFTFGHARSGTTALLREWAAVHGVPVLVHDAIRVDHEPVSSTRLRQAIRAGDLDTLERLLGGPYTLGGVTAPGAGRGRGIGIPTFNLYFPGQLTPPRGVYATRVWLDGQRYPSISNLGVRPSFDDGEQCSFETMILGPFDGNAGHGSRIDVELLAYVREERAFADPEALRGQIQQDVDVATAVHAARTD
jgi:riboflavin kinase/FMN adenylyltransferase